jgi:mono/diheme cytochrome c family protein
VDAVFASMLELVKTATEGYEKLGWSDWAEVQRTAFVPPMKTKPLPFQFPKGGDEPPPAPRGRLYQTQCAGCHGDDAGGAVNEDAEGRPTPIPALAGSKLDYAAFAAVVRAGRGDRGMPWWTPDAISDDDLRALYDAATRP